MTSPPLGIGLIGAGAFGEFCLAAFAELPEVRIAAIADTNAERAAHFARQYGARPYSRYQNLLADPAVQVVALNTPPAFHAVQGLAAIRAGKHLFCEKPLALTVDDGERLVRAAQSAGLLLTVDYVMRKNALWAACANLRARGRLGALLHMSLENHAAGLDLATDHWFWDKAVSGGIWIEHGVHFFDAFAWVAGQPGIVTAAAAFRQASGREDRVECLARYSETAAHFYHGFTHSGATERTTVRLTFERGYVTLDEWIPTSLTLWTRELAADIVPLLPGLVTIEPQPNDGASLIRAVLPEGKPAVYRRSIQDGILQLARAAHGEAELMVTGAMGLDSLKMAVAAEVLGRAAS